MERIYRRIIMLVATKDARRLLPEMTNVIFNDVHR